MTRRFAVLGAIAATLSVAGCATDCEVEPRSTIVLTDAEGAAIEDAHVECTIDGVPQVVTTLPGLAWCVAQPGLLQMSVEWRGAVVDLGWNVVERPEECPAIPSRIFDVVLVE